MGGVFAVPVRRHGHVAVLDGGVVAFGCDYLGEKDLFARWGAEVDWLGGGGGGGV